MLSGIFFRWSFVCRINSLLLSGFPFTSFHLAKANLVPRPIQNLFFTFFLQRKDVLGSGLSWILAICFFVTLYSCVCSCLKTSRNVFYIFLIYKWFVFFDLIRLLMLVSLLSKSVIFTKLGFFNLAAKIFWC